MKELTVSAIEEGTVIDHIPSDMTFKVVDILDLEDTNEIISVATNLESKGLGKKGIIKVGGKKLSEAEVNKIALIAPNVTVNFIKNYDVVEKTNVKIPEVIEGIVKCFNPNCITNYENITTKFHLINESPLRIRCHYCERIIEKGEILLI